MGEGKYKHRTVQLEVFEEAQRHVVKREYVLEIGDVHSSDLCF